MTEAELAAYYQAHKDDQDVWEADPAPPQPSADKGKVRAVYSVRFSRPELATIDAIAQQHGITYSEAIRRAVLAYGSVERRWEYRGEIAAEDDVVRLANDLGGQGWELVSTALRSATEYHIFFKRPAVTTS